MNIKFTIIIPSLNSNFFLKQCLQSIFDQTYKNYEIIVIDGGSNDGTIEFLKTLGGKVKWISEKDNGQSDAINKGISLSSGDWITWQNCDDYYHNKNALYIFANAIKKKKNKLLFVGNIILVNSENKILRDVKYFTPYFYSLLYEGMTLTNQACFWSKNLHLKIGNLKNFRINFDYEWFLRILKNFPNCGYHLNYSLGSYRLHKNQKTQKQNSSDVENLKKIQIDYGYKKNYVFLIKIYLLVRKFFCYLFQGNFFYILRGFFKFFFIRKNKEYIDS
ncbi:glycosyltransferase family 2 protein [Candidatus Pelagibacter sp. HIMB1748]|uniref:glycosyltransferase family 2 protein n=1 Tax=unclassified Candidatus Pelagibacter TaxID=2647897 RepID=UPI003F87E99B